MKDLPGGAYGPKAISAGYAYTCARLLTNPGFVRCWGYDADGQLGDGTTTTRLVPVVVQRLGYSREVSAGGDHTCVITPGTVGTKEPAAVKCWGDNSYGQLGDGTRTSSSVPVEVKGLLNGRAFISAAQISAGYSHTCALQDPGVVKCWGSNSYGQLGDGTRTHSSVPVDVKGLS